VPPLSPFTPSPKQQERIEKIRLKGRAHFIFYNGMLRFGLLVSALTTLWDWYDKYGWRIPFGDVLHHNLADILFRLILWLTMGYFWGAMMWKTIMRPRAES
jgi:hypothetical protein